MSVARRCRTDHPRALILTVPVQKTPFGEMVGGDQIELITASLELTGWRTVVARYDPGTVKQVMRSEEPDIVFNLAYGFIDPANGIRELQCDVAARLEALGCTCVGSSAASQRVAQDKVLTAERLQPIGIASPAPLAASAWPETTLLGVRKPRHGAGHRNVSIVYRSDRFAVSLEPCWLLQAYVDGPEYTIAVMNDSSGAARALPAVRIDFIDQDGPALLTPDGEGTRSATDFAAPALLADRAVAAFLALGLRDYARFDFRIAANGEPVLLDANALPGLHPTGSLFVQAANAGGLDYHQLISHLASRALRRRSGQ